MKAITPELLNSFRAPAFPGSFLISFEGIEGAGKSSQIIQLKNFLEKKNFRVIILREPGGTSFGEKLRQAILENKSDICPLAEAHLFASSRAQLMTEVTMKELSAPNTIVIYDRFIDSSLAYQGHARGLGISEVLEIHNIFPLNLVPHLTFYLYIDVETSIERQKIRNSTKDYFESKGEAFYKKLIVGYDMALELFPRRIKRLDAKRDVASISHEINGLVETLIYKNDEV
jgi:dTMP kinase